MAIDVARVMKRQSKYQPYESILERDPAFEWKEPAPIVEPKNKWQPVLLALPFIVPFGIFSVLGMYRELYPVTPVPAHGMATSQMGDQTNAHAGYNADIVIGDPVEALRNDNIIIDPGGHYSHDHVIDLNYGHKRSHKKH